MAKRNFTRDEIRNMIQNDSNSVNRVFGMIATPQTRNLPLDQRVYAPSPNIGRSGNPLNVRGKMGKKKAESFTEDGFVDRIFNHAHDWGTGNIRNLFNAPAGAGGAAPAPAPAAPAPAPAPAPAAVPAAPAPVAVPAPVAGAGGAAPAMPNQLTKEEKLKEEKRYYNELLDFINSPEARGGRHHRVRKVMASLGRVGDKIFDTNLDDDTIKELKRTAIIKEFGLKDLAQGRSGEDNTVSRQRIYDYIDTVGARFREDPSMAEVARERFRERAVEREEQGYSRRTADLAKDDIKGKQKVFQEIVQEARQDDPEERGIRTAVRGSQSFRDLPGGGVDTTAPPERYSTTRQALSEMRGIEPAFGTAGSETKIDPERQKKLARMFQDKIVRKKAEWSADGTTLKTMNYAGTEGVDFTDKASLDQELKESYQAFATPRDLTGDQLDEFQEKYEETINRIKQKEGESEDDYDDRVNETERQLADFEFQSKQYEEMFKREAQIPNFFNQFLDNGNKFVGRVKPNAKPNYIMINEQGDVERKSKADYIKEYANNPDALAFYFNTHNDKITQLDKPDVYDSSQHENKMGGIASVNKFTAGGKTIYMYHGSDRGHISLAGGGKQNKEKGLAHDPFLVEYNDPLLTGDFGSILNKVGIPRVPNVEANEILRVSLASNMGKYNPVDPMNPYTSTPTGINPNRLNLTDATITGKFTAETSGKTGTGTFNIRKGGIQNVVLPKAERLNSLRIQQRNSMMGIKVSRKIKTLQVEPRGFTGLT